MISKNTFFCIKKLDLIKLGCVKKIIVKKLNNPFKIFQNLKLILKMKNDLKTVWMLHAIVSTTVFSVVVSKTLNIKHHHNSILNFKLTMAHSFRFDSYHGKFLHFLVSRTQQHLFQLEALQEADKWPQWYVAVCLNILARWLSFDFRLD